MACGDLIQGSVLDCTNIMQGGVGENSRLYLILKDDIASYTEDTTGRVTAITLNSSKSAYPFDGFKQSLKPKFERAQAPSGQTLYKHTAEFFYFEYNQLAKNNLARMGNGRYVAIYGNAKQDANTFEILGLDVGLEMTEMMRALQENGGAMKIVLSSPENEFETRPPRTFYDGTSYASTKTLLFGYAAIPTITNVSPLAAAAAGGTSLTFTGTKFFGGGVNNAVLFVRYVNNATGAIVNQTTFTVASDTSITCSSVAMAAGSYKVQITTIKGVALSEQNLIVS